MPPPARGTNYTSQGDVASLLSVTGCINALSDYGDGRTGIISAATNATPIQRTAAGHGLSTGDLIEIARSGLGNPRRERQLDRDRHRRQHVHAQSVDR